MQLVHSKDKQLIKMESKQNQHHEEFIEHYLKRVRDGVPTLPHDQWLKLCIETSTGLCISNNWFGVTDPIKKETISITIAYLLGRKVSEKEYNQYLKSIGLENK